MNPEETAKEVDPIEQARNVKQTQYVLAVGMKCPVSGKIRFHIANEVVSAGVSGLVLEGLCDCGCNTKLRATPAFKMMPGMPPGQVSSLSPPQGASPRILLK